MNENLNFVDLFAGAGGFSLGFEMAGYNLICAIEKDDWAVQTLKANHVPNKIIQGDISQIENIAELVKQRPLVIIGGPPCQGFSTASSKHDPKDPRNSLFLFFVNWVEELKPKFFVMENVPGILNRKNAKGEKISKIIKESFESLGYGVNIWKLNAAEYGVPQSRERIFFVGSNDGSIMPPPTKTHYYKKTQSSNLKPVVTVEDAIMDLPQIMAGEGSEVSSYDYKPLSEFQKWARNESHHLYNHVCMKHTPRLVERFKVIQNGLDFSELPNELKVRARNGNGAFSSSRFNSNYRHLKLNEPSHTIPASFYSSFIHPTIPRNLTTREAARIQSFPDNYKFKGKRTLISKKLLQKLGKDDSDKLSQYNQVGNAVPPLLSKAIANHIKSFLSEQRLEDQKLKVFA